MAACRNCQSDLEPFLDFGRMPLANAFLTADLFASEYFFNLTAAFCTRCALVQLADQPPRERMFNQHYPFFSATSSRMQSHFAALAADVIEVVPRGDPFVIEIGSNDGTLLRHVAEAGIRHLGIEPSASVASAAIARGINTSGAFFDAALARRIVAEHGPADAVIAANALSHVADLHGVVEGIDIVLAADGVAVIEDPYWGSVVARTAFDQIYDEHASYFSVAPLQQLFAQHGLTMFDAVPFDVHGGSMRYWIGRGSRPASRRLAELIEQERASGLHRRDTLDAFRARVLATGEALMACLRSCKAQGLRVVGYGATSKSTTTINFFGITPALVEFISDTTPAKHGTFTPGAHIPVRPHEEFAAHYPERALLFSWNHAAEILNKERAFAASGGRWIVYVPELHEV
jgi:methylation protein EvaC